MIDYEEWFERNTFAYEAELQAVRLLLPTSGTGMEIGVGFHNLGEITKPDPVKKGYGEGAFVVVKGIK